MSIDKSQINNFSELVQEIYRTFLKVCQQLLQTALEKLDDELLGNRDTGKVSVQGVSEDLHQNHIGCCEI